MHHQIVKSEDIISRRIGDETVVIKDNGLSTHVLNKTAAYIWELCDGTYGLDAITGRVCERFDVGTEEAGTDVKATIDRLLEIGLLTRLEVAKT
ncbi:MAG: hypothetical protein A2Z29_01595 [Chloroflexi bacterium RBG_16_56_11]|nr:MAG: hypothetical protein A2Z29_01595 [Chloroflexi bacterium RBG_16_56_11]